MNEINNAKIALFQTLTVLLVFRDKILAGIPKAGNPLDFYMDSKHMSDEAKADFEDRVADGKVTDQEKEVIKSLNWCCFEKQTDNVLCLWHGNIKAGLREIFVTLGLTQKMYKKAKSEKVGSAAEEGHAGGKQTLQHAVHVEPLRLPFFRPDSQGCDRFITEPDGFVDRVKHIEDAAGKRSVIGRHDYLLQPRLQFTLRWPKKGPFDRRDIINALAASEEDGLGACRSQGFGKYDIISIKDN